MKRSLTGLAMALLVVGGCSFLGDSPDEPQGKPIARVFQEMLFAEDITDLIKPGTSSEDSVELVNNYIDSWIRKQIILHYAKENPNIDNEEIQEKLENYQQALVSYYYEREIVRQKLDTVVADSEIEEYFSEYQQNFELKEDILRFRFVHLKQETPKMDSVRLWLKSNTPQDRSSLEEHCLQYALAYNLDETSWFVYEHVKQEIPLLIHNPASYFSYRKHVEVKDSSDLYLVAVDEFVGKGTISPLGYVKDDITKIILNKRKLNLINETYDKMYDEALRKEQFEVYE